MSPATTHHVSYGLQGPIRADDVIELLEMATKVDGVSPVGEQGVLAIRHGSPKVRHLWIAPGGQLTAYAQLDDNGSAELTVHPAHRHQGMGTSLVTALRQASGELAIWAHGNLPAAQRLATSTGLHVTRELWQMARELPAAALRPPEAPAGMVLRNFKPGRDEQVWVELNARAFVDHPEQGRMTVADLNQRQAEEWFDPELLWLAHPEGEPNEPLAAMWIKVLPGSSDGEIYAVGVDPDSQGQGLGGWLTAEALVAGQARNLQRITLFVEGDNTPAIRTYEREGFQQVAIDVQYAA